MVVVVIPLICQHVNICQQKEMQPSEKPCRIFFQDNGGLWFCEVCLSFICSFDSKWNQDRKQHPAEKFPEFRCVSPSCTSTAEDWEKFLHLKERCQGASAAYVVYNGGEMQQLATCKTSLPEVGTRGGKQKSGNNLTRKVVSLHC